MRKYSTSSLEPAELTMITGMVRRLESCLTPAKKLVTAFFRQIHVEQNHVRTNGWTLGRTAEQKLNCFFSVAGDGQVHVEAAIA